MRCVGGGNSSTVCVNGFCACSVVQQHSGAAMQRTRHLKVGAMTAEQREQVNAAARARHQKRRDLAKAAGLTHSDMRSDAALEAERQATAQGAAAHALTQDHFILSAPLTAGCM